MKKINQLILLLIIPATLFFSCGNSNGKDYTSNPNTQRNPEIEKLIGQWKISDPSGDLDKATNYVFREDNSGLKYTGSNPFLIQSEPFDYELDSQNGATRIILTDKKLRKTIFKINNIDANKIRIVMETVNDERINNGGLVEMRRQEQE